MKKLAIISTHPIQYNAPLFRLLSQRNKIALKVFYTWSQSADGNIFDPGFGIQKKWDIPLLEGYDHCFVKNNSSKPGSNHFFGIKNPSLIKEVKAYQPDAVLIYGWSFQSHLQAMRYFKNRIPVYFRGDSTLLGEPSKWTFKKVARRIALKWVYSYVDIALYAGRFNKLYFKAHGLKESQLVHMPHAVDNNRFASSPDADVIRQRTGIPSSHHIVLYAGKLEAVKDLFLLLSAFRSLQKENAHLVFVGNGHLENELRNASSENCNVHFLPFANQSEMPSIYKSANVFVLPSKSETWGLAINEAMACSLPVIVSDKCGCSVDLVHNGKNGYVFQSGNKEELAASLSDVLKNENTLRNFGKESRSIINNWSFEKCAEIIENEFGK